MVRMLVFCVRESDSFQGWVVSVVRMLVFALGIGLEGLGGEDAGIPGLGGEDAGICFGESDSFQG